MINTERHLAYTLKVNMNEILSIIKNIDQYYYEKTVIKKNIRGQCKKRVLNPSLRRLKIIQERIHHRILNHLKMPEYAFGAVKGKNNVLNAKKHLGSKYFFTTDIKNFFPSITHKKVFQVFYSTGFSPSVARILTQLTTYKGQLPLGCPTSPTLSNLAFYNAGNYLQKFAVNNNITFTAFIDDLTFSSKIDFKEKVPMIVDIIRESGFKMNHNKTNYKTHNATITGIIIKSGKLELPIEFNSVALLSDKYKTSQIAGYKQYFTRITN